MKKKKNIIIMFLLSIIVINVSDYIIRKIQKQNMYKSEIKGVVWDIFLKRGGNHYHYNRNDKGDYFVDEHFFNGKPSNIIKKNDSVYKAPNSEKLYIYRKINNTYVLIGQSQKWW